MISLLLLLSLFQHHYYCYLYQACISKPLVLFIISVSMYEQQKKYNNHRAKKKIESIEESSKYPDLEDLKSNYNRFNTERKNLQRFVSSKEYKSSLKQSSFSDYRSSMRNKKVMKNYYVLSTPPPQKIMMVFNHTFYTVLLFMKKKRIVL